LGLADSQLTARLRVRPGPLYPHYFVMDPASIIGLTAATGQVLQAIYQYGDGVLDCKLEVARLRAELYGIKAALSQIEQDLAYLTTNPGGSLASPNLTSPESRQILVEARNLLVPLARSLDGDISSSRRLARKLAWPLKRKEVVALSTHLERFKTYFILAATNDTLQATREVSESLRNIQVSLDDLSTTGEKRSTRADSEKWLAPYDAEPAHRSALAVRVQGTNDWFINTVLANWTSGSPPLLWLKGKPGSGKTCMTAACAERLVSRVQDIPLID
jgi:hypothetical protein